MLREGAEELLVQCCPYSELAGGIFVSQDRKTYMPYHHTESIQVSTISSSRLIQITVIGFVGPMARDARSSSQAVRCTRRQPALAALRGLITVGLFPYLKVPDGEEVSVGGGTDDLYLSPNFARRSK